jgi:flagellar basal body-associated protein FliL
MKDFLPEIPHEKELHMDPKETAIETTEKTPKAPMSSKKKIAIGVGIGVVAVGAAVGIYFLTSKSGAKKPAGK